MLGRLQDWLTPVWKRLCAGCHLNRNTFELIQRTGFRVVRVKGYASDLFLVVEAENMKGMPGSDGQVFGAEKIQMLTMKKDVYLPTDRGTQWSKLVSGGAEAGSY